MSEPPRLRGIILRAEGEELIVKASPAYVAKFAARHEAAVQQGQMSMSPDYAQSVIQGQTAAGPYVMPGQLLFDALGRQIAIVETVHYSIDPVEVTPFDAQQRVYTHGARFCQINARGLP